MGKKAKTFRQDFVRLNRCPCGADKMTWIPATINTDGTKMYHAMCDGCGDIVSNHSCSARSIHHFKDAWNSHMAKRQEQANGNITETKQEEEIEE